MWEEVLREQRLMFFLNKGMSPKRVVMACPIKFKDNKLDNQINIMKVNIWILIT